jgi:hypothetical protein
MPVNGSRAIAIALAMLAPALGHAEEPSTGPSEPAGAAKKQAEDSRFRDPQDGQIDLSSFLENPRSFLPVPVIVTEPAVGYGGGLIGMFLRPRKEAGGEGWARPNISAIGGFATENGTWGAFAADASRWMNGRLESLAGGGTGQLNLDFYGLAADEASLDQPVRYTLDFTAALLQGNWHLEARSPWSFGLRYIYAQVEPRLRDAPAFPGLVNNTEVEVSAPGLLVEYDSRDNVFTPSRGFYSESVLFASREALGASQDFERFQQMLMTWFPVRENLTLGLRGDYQWTSDDTPFFLRPYVKLRGVQAMRYQGDEMASIEIEARWRFHGRWSAIMAAGAGTARSDRETLSASQDVTSGAIGLRYELARKFGLHAGLDVGFSSETTAVYIQVGNAWFRP